MIYTIVIDFLRLMEVNRRVKREGESRSFEIWKIIYDMHNRTAWSGLKAVETNICMSVGKSTYVVRK